ncbi:MAG: ABC transporter substrate-binding protein [Burkholderiales bacterium]|nr:ABC transporter substrate-binding protein [Burkholderiales bacterium]
MKMLRSLCLLFMAVCLHAQAVTLVTEDYPPFNIVNPKNGEVTGMSTEKIRILMQRAGEKYTINAYPWARSIQMAQNNPDTCVYSTSRTPGREQLYQWVGPLVKNNWVIFARKDDLRHPKTLEDLRTYVIGTYRNDAIAEYFSLKGFNTELASIDADNPRKMLAGRFDFWATGELLGWDILKHQGLSKMVVQLFTFNQTEMYLACHDGMDKTKLDHWNQILKDMEKDGTSAAIEKKYKNVNP